MDFNRKGEKSMTKTKKRGVIIGSVVTAVAVVSASFALWSTTLNGNGSVTASGNWQVEITDADLKLSSTGASASVGDLALVRSGEKADTLIASVISSSTWLSADQQDLLGTQSDEPMSRYTYYYAVDSTKYDLTDITSITEEEYQQIAADPSTFVVSDHLNMYYRYVTGVSDGTPETSAMTAQKVVDGLLRDTTAALQVMYPASWQNYVLVDMDSHGTWNYVIASMGSASGEETATFTATDAAYADVEFTLPGAWAQYSVTVENKGTANANLEDAVIRLDTEDADQLSLDAPDLSGKTLAPGESCTITVVVEALDDGSDTLDASGRLSIELPFVQDTVEEAPSASYTK